MIQINFIGIFILIIISCSINKIKKKIINPKKAIVPPKAFPPLLSIKR